LAAQARDIQCAPLAGRIVLFVLIFSIQVFDF